MICALAALISGCGSATDTTLVSTATGGMGGASAASTASGTGGGTASSTASSTDASSSTGATMSSSSGGMMTYDPNLDGPYTVAELDDTTTVASTGHKEAIHCAYPTAGPSAGPFPVIVVGHGFQLPPTQYASYLRRLASFGYVALTADFPAGFLNVNNVENAKDFIGGLDWAATSPKLGGKADVNTAGATGHSLGGKVALLAATMDARIKASITLDPVDGAMGCSPQNCPDVSNLMPTLAIPTGFIGETIDAKGAFQACAPAANNYTTFYVGTKSPSLEVTALGANHMSFLDDVASCPLTCSFCNAASAPNAQVNAMAKALVVAFYERHLRGDANYDTYLTGSEVTARYVATKQATITSK